MGSLLGPRFPDGFSIEFLDFSIMRQSVLMGLSCIEADAATMHGFCVQRSLFGLCHRLRRLLEGVLEAGGVALAASRMLTSAPGA